MPRQVVIKGPERQRPDERVAYQLVIDATSYPSAASPVSKLYELTGGTDVSATKLTGSPTIGPATIEGVLYPQVFNSSLVISSVAATSYRLEFQFTSGGNTFEPYLIIDGVE